ncbi:MAG: L-threonylcarbamoyladenylate synthase [Methyloligellaceae bacterium]
MARIVKNREGIEVAAKKLQTGHVVSLPTETVYGLGADARDGVAVASIFALKGRPQFNPLIVHVENIEEADRIGEFNEISRKLAHELWPGPLTLVLPRKSDCGISELVTAGLDTIALRVPQHPVAQEILGLAGCPIAAPSANLSGRISPTTAEHVADDFEDVDLLVVDGGQTGLGLESTVVTCTDEGIFILRPGTVTAEDLEKATGEKVIIAEADELHPVSPGQLLSHYAPNCNVRLNAASVTPTEGLLAFGQNIPEGARETLNLSESGDLKEAAANLFAMLRELDAEDLSGIAVMPIPEEGLGVSINDRLKRAAAPRD